MPEESSIGLHDGGTMFAGRDSVDYFRAGQFKTALSLYAKTGMKMTRGAGVKRLLDGARPYLPPGERFPASREGAAAAAEAVEKWRNNMLSALPVVDTRKENPDGEGKAPPVDGGAGREDSGAEGPG